MLAGFLSSVPLAAAPIATKTVAKRTPVQILWRFIHAVSFFSIVSGVWPIDLAPIIVLLDASDRQRTPELGQRYLWHPTLATERTVSHKLLGRKPSSRRPSGAPRTGQQGSLQCVRISHTACDDRERFSALVGCARVPSWADRGLRLTRVARSWAAGRH